MPDPIEAAARELADECDIDVMLAEAILRKHLDLATGGGAVTRQADLYMVRDIDGNIGLQLFPAMQHDKLLARKHIVITEGEFDRT